MKGKEEKHVKNREKRMYRRKKGKIRFSIGDLNGEREQCLNLKANLYVHLYIHISSYHISLDHRSQYYFNLHACIDMVTTRVNTVNACDA